MTSLCSVHRRPLQRRTPVQSLGTARAKRLDTCWGKGGRVLLGEDIAHGQQMSRNSMPARRAPQMTHGIKHPALQAGCTIRDDKDFRIPQVRFSSTG
jgi:hypothetical protein